MKLYNFILLYAYSVVIANLFYFHNSIFGWNRELFLTQVDNYPIVKIYLLALVISILLVIMYYILRQMFK